MVTKTLVRVSDGAIMSTVAVTAPNDENRNNHQPPKKKDEGSDDKKIAVKETAVKHHNVSTDNNEGDVDNMNTTHVTKKKDEKKSTARGTRRSSRQKRPIVFNNDVDEDTDRDKKKRRRKQGKEKLIIDLKDVPMQVPILKHDGKKGAISSKYLGVCWDKSNKKWMARIKIEGKNHYIGYYNNEEDAAADYARAVFKYNGGSDRIDRLRAQQRVKASLEKIDLSGVPMQVPILKHDGKTDGLSSKYLGVYWDKSHSKWRADVTIDGKQRHIGYYNNEEDAAADYARAVFKYDGGNVGIDRLRTKQRVTASLEKIDLSDVPKQVPILKHDGKGSSTSKYKGVSFQKASNKWKTEIRIDRKQRFVGYYDNEEDAATDYARAVFKYDGGNDGIERLKAQLRKASLEKIDLSGVPKQLLIMKPNGKGNSASKYKGVGFHKAKNKWFAQITIDGKQRHIGIYDNEEDAATDYARAVFKYKGGSAEVKRQDESQQLFNLTKIPAIPPAGYDPLKGGQSQHYRLLSMRFDENED